MPLLARSNQAFAQTKQAFTQSSQAFAHCDTIGGDIRDFKNKTDMFKSQALIDQSTLRNDYFLMAKKIANRASNGSNEDKSNTYGMSLQNHT